PLSLCKHLTALTATYTLSLHDALPIFRSSGTEAGDLVMEFGAGPGILTSALAATGARVIAVERHTGFVARLERRFGDDPGVRVVDRKSTRLNSSHVKISYAVFCLKKKI